jgi:uncharacterized protein YkwD
MRGLFHSIIILIAAIGLAIAFAAPASAKSAAEEAELDAARQTPLIFYALRSAVSYRHGGLCRSRLDMLQRATEDLEYYRRYLRQNPKTDNMSQGDIDAAQRALDREKRRACNPNAEEQQFAADVSALPALTGTVQAMPSQSQPGASPQRYEETNTAITALRNDETRCDIETYRRWMETYYEMLQDLRQWRDAALAAGEFSEVDAWRAHFVMLKARSIVRMAEYNFLRYRIRCAKMARDDSRQDQREQTPQEGNQCVPGGGASGCDYVPEPGCKEGTEPQCDFEPRCFENDAGGCDYRLPDLPPPECEPEGCSWNEPLTDDEQAMLDVHNEARHDFGVPPLLWDAGLAASAAEYAKVIAETGQLVHAPREGREHERENLLATNIGYRSPAEMIEVMVAEKQYYKPGIYPDISTTGDWYPVGHYTQIVWPWTTHVGCAIESGEFFEYTVCRYTPPGNRDGNPLVPGGNGWEQAATD